jgi:tetratricopeptide (TPR) repeat protein
VKSAKRINVRLLLAILAAVLLVAVTVVVVHRVQIRRNAQGLAALARTKVAEGKPGEAIALFARYLSFRPNDAAAQAEFAKLVAARADRADASRGERAQAYDAIESAVSKNPSDRQLRIILADLMLKAGRFGAAGEQLDILLQADAGAAASEAAGPGTPPADSESETGGEDRETLLLMRARAHLGMGRYKEAAGLLAGICGFDLEKKEFPAESPATASATKDIGLVVYQASVFLSALLEEKLRDPQSAQAVLDHLVDVNPDDFRGWLARANWHRSHEAFDAAAADLAKAAELAPEDAGVLFTSFEIAIAQQRFAAAEQLIAKTRSLFPGDERVFRGIASVAARQGQMERATNVLREALSSKLNEHYRVNLMLVDVLLLQGRLEEAEKEIAAFAEKYGADGPEIGLMESRLLIAQRRWLPARKKLEAVRPLVATSTELTNQVDILLGQCHEQLGEFDEQLAANRRVLSDDHKSVAARIGSAAALATIGRSDEALAEYEALAEAMSTEQLTATPQAWSPLLQLRVAQQLKRPTAERDWSRTDELLDLLEQSPAISSTQLALLKSDACVRKGDSAAAEQLLRAQLAVDPQSPQLTAALMTLLLRTEGAAAARELLQTAPPEVRQSLVVMVVEAQVAARMSADESQALFTAIETRADSMTDEQGGQLLANLGAIRRGTGSPAEADRLWTAALKKRPDDVQILTALLESACERGDVVKANATAAEIGRLSGQESPQGRVAAAAALVLAVRQGQAGRAADRERPAAGRGGAELTPDEKNQLTAAFNLLVEAENERPGWVRIQKLFAEIAGLRGDVPEAIERLQRASAMGSLDPAVLRQLLALLYLSNRLDEAQQTLARLGPEGVSGLERLSAEIELSTGKFDDAVALAERSVDADANASVDELLWFGQVLSRAGKLDRATEVLQRAVNADPKRPDGWLALLSSQFTAGQRRAAERTLDRAAEALEPPRRQAVLAQGSEMLGRIEDAERYFREVAAADRRNLAAARGLASFLVRRGRLVAARDELREIVASADDAPDAAAIRVWARRALATLISQSGGYRDLEESLTLLQQNAEGGKLPAEDIAITVGILANRPEPDNWRRAIDLLDQLAALQPLSNAQRIQRAQLLEKCGRWDDARNELVAVVSRPNTPLPVQSLLIEKLIMHGERDSARLWLKKMADRFPDAPPVHALRARLAVADNDRVAATDAARKLMPDESRPLQPEQLGSIAALMEQLGFDKAADKVFERYAAASRAGVLARAAFLGRQHRTDESLDLLEQQWDRLPLLPLMQTAVLALRAQGTGASAQQRERVAAWFTKAERQDPDSTPLKLLFADMQSLDGRDDDAIAIYRDLLGRDDLPALQAAVVSNNLAYLLARPATAAEAEKLVDAAIVELGPSPDVLDTRGVVLLAAGKTSEAVATLKEAVLAPSAAKYLHLACALAADRQIEEARKALDQAKSLGLDPATLPADEQLRLTTLQAGLGG